MSNMYLVELEIEYKGVCYQEFVKTWLADVEFFLAKQKEGVAKHLFKVAAERKVYIVIEQSKNEMDKMMFETPLMKSLGDQVKVTVTELMGYEAFANQTNEMISSDIRYGTVDTVPRDGVYIWAEFNVGYTGHSMEELLRIWSEEAAVAMGAKSQGIVVDIWKCVGMRRVHVLLNFDKIERLDQMTFNLPIMRQNGDNVDLKIKPLIKFESLADHLKQVICC